MYSWECVCLFDLTGMQSLPSAVPAVQRSRVVVRAVGLSSVTTVNSCGTQIRPVTPPDSRELRASGSDPSDHHHSATARRAALLVRPLNTHTQTFKSSGSVNYKCFHSRAFGADLTSEFGSFYFCKISYGRCGPKKTKAKIWLKWIFCLLIF